MTGMYFEDIELGGRERFGRYAVTAEEIIAFAQKYDPQPFHIDPEAAKRSLFGGLCASGWHTCAMAMRMMVDRMKETGTYSLGSPGVDEVRWKRPVYPGDVLSLEVEIIDKRRSRSRPGIGIIRNRYRVFNQKGEEVMSFIGNAFIPCRTTREETGETGEAAADAAGSADR